MRGLKQISAEDLDLAIHSMWIFLNSVLVLWMQIGFALLEVGSTRVWHVKNILIKNVVDGAITIALFFAVGFAFYYDGGPFVGNKYFFLAGAESDPRIMAAFLLIVAFGSSCTTIVSGALAERCKLVAYFVFSAVMGSIIFPLAAHWVWSGSGFLSAYNPTKLFQGSIGYLDYAGSSVVHAIGGSASLVGVAILGPRLGRFGPDGTVCELQGMVGNSGVYKVTGSLMLFVCFLAFNASSVVEVSRIKLAPLIASNTMLAASFSCFAVMGWKLFVKHFNVHFIHCIDGLLAGCVAITAGAGLMQPWAAMITGIVGGLLYDQTNDLLLRLQLDDVVSAVSIHLTPGIWGPIAVGFFGKEILIREAYGEFEYQFDQGVVYGGSGKLLGMQVMGAFLLALWAAATSGGIFLSLRFLGLFRESDDVQISMHGGFKGAEAYSWKRYPAAGGQQQGGELAGPAAHNGASDVDGP